MAQPIMARIYNSLYFKGTSSPGIAILLMLTRLLSPSRVTTEEKPKFVRINEPFLQARYFLVG
jgi:hypothetical protein